MRDFSKIKDSMKRAIMLHFKKNVPVSDLAIRDDQKDMISRVEYLVEAYKQTPDIDVYRLLYEMNKSRFTTSKCTSALRSAHQEELFFYYAISKDVLDIEVVQDGKEKNI